MAVTVSTPEKGLTLADLVDRFGPMPAERIRTNPPPGTATEQDVIDIEQHEFRLCELVDGVEISGGDVLPLRQLFEQTKER